MRDTFEPLKDSHMDTVSAPTVSVQLKPAVPLESEIPVSDPKLPQTDANHNLSILSLHKSGKSAVEIARDLGLGTGEVKLVIDLFEEEK